MRRLLVAVACLLTGAGLLWLTERGDIAGALLLGVGCGLGALILFDR
jgi:hypothetical protein